MSTEKYKKFFKRLYDDGQIPEDLYRSEERRVGKECRL